MLEIGLRLLDRFRGHSNGICHRFHDRLDRTTAWVSVSDRTSRGVEGLLTVLPIVCPPVVMRFGKAQTWSIW